MNSPCYTPERPECPNRKVGCRSTCDKWAEFEVQKAKRYEERRLELERIWAEKDINKEITRAIRREMKR